jgi:ABC-2 type transport system permease protein
MKTSNSPQKKNRQLRTKVRITWAIAWKDIVEALKNKNSLSVILIALPMLFIYYYLPILSSKGEPPLIRVYDPGESRLVARMESSDSVNVRTYPSEAEMKKALTSADIPQIGLVIPADFDENPSSGQTPQLKGYVPIWVNQGDAAELRQDTEAQIASLLGQSVSIVMGEPVPLDPDSRGVGTTAGFWLIFMATMIGLLVTPHLLLEEKKTGTIEMLRISPARPWNLVTGKAIAGLFYCLVGTVVGVMFYQWLIVHYWLVLLTMLLGSLFTISMGLFLGSITESREQMTIWSWIFILPLFFPVFLTQLVGLVPNQVIAVLRYFPTPIAFDLIRASFAVTPGSTVWLQLLMLSAWVGSGLLLVVGIVRYQDHFSERPAAKTKTEHPSIPNHRGSTGWWNALQEWVSSTQTHPSQNGWEDEIYTIEEQGKVTGKPSRWRIIWTIASKDILATIKNRTAISIIIGTVFVLASYASIPLLLRRNSSPAAVVYDESQSATIRQLSLDPDLRVALTDSRETFQKTIRGSQEVLMGLSIPEDFEEKVENAQKITLQGYFVHWADSKQASLQASIFEEKLNALVPGEIRIQVADQRVYPSANPEGQMVMFSWTFAIVLFTFGLALTPLVFVEERESHTLDVLLISPATYSDVVIGKALGGGFYCLLAAVVVFIFNHYLIVHWGIAILAVLLGSGLAVSLGLLIGIATENTTSMRLWGSLTLFLILALSILGVYQGSQWPPTIATLFDYLPTTAFLELLGFSMAGEIPTRQLWIHAALLSLSIAIILVLVRWRLRQVER